MTNKQWKAICADIEDRRGLKWEWAKIDADVKREIRKSWEKILDEPPAPEISIRRANNE